MAASKNVLLLVADDLGKCLGCYGDETIRTPNIDKLASKGTIFSNAFASTASCSGSRSVIYTGLHTHENGQYGLNNGRHHFTTFDHIETAPQVFRSLNYLTAILGKVHVGPSEVYPWEVREESTSRDVAWVAARAGVVFERAKEEGRSFFLTIGYIDPHRDRSRDGFGNREAFSASVKQVRYDPAQVRVPDFLSDLLEIRQELASYYESISRLDQGIGFILEALQQSGLENDTMVVFVSDNGPPFINSKTTLYDAGVRLPLLVRAPGSPENVVNPNMVSFIDILPTLLDWAGSPHLKSIRLGRSFLPIISEQELVPDWPQQVFGSHSFHEITNYYPTRYMRTERYKYHRNIEWKLNFPFAADLYGSLTLEAIRSSTDGGAGGGGHRLGKRSLRSYVHRPAEELYDLEADPHEVNNLALAPNQQQLEQLEGMRLATQKWQERTRDPWLYRDGVSIELVRHHIEAGMFVPDRWEFEVENPGTEGCRPYRLFYEEDSTEDDGAKFMNGK